MVRYREASRRWRDIVRSFGCIVQKKSIDECYVDLSLLAKQRLLMLCVPHPLAARLHDHVKARWIMAQRHADADPVLTWERGGSLAVAQVVSRSTDPITALRKRKLPDVTAPALDRRAACKEDLLKLGLDETSADTYLTAAQYEFENGEGSFSDIVAETHPITWCRAARSDQGVASLVRIPSTRLQYPPLPTRYAISARSDTDITTQLTPPNPWVGNVLLCQEHDTVEVTEAVRMRTHEDEEIIDTTRKCLAPTQPKVEWDWFGNAKAIDDIREAAEKRRLGRIEVETLKNLENKNPTTSTNHNDLDSVTEDSGSTMGTEVIDKDGHVVPEPNAGVTLPQVRKRSGDNRGATSQVEVKRRRLDPGSKEAPAIMGQSGQGELSPTASFYAPSLEYLTKGLVCATCGRWAIPWSHTMSTALEGAVITQPSSSSCQFNAQETQEGHRPLTVPYPLSESSVETPCDCPVSAGVIKSAASTTSTHRGLGIKPLEDPLLAGGANNKPDPASFVVPNDSVTRIHTLLMCIGAQIALEIRYKLFYSEGLTTSAGIAPNCMVAKMASQLHKPNQQSIVLPSLAWRFMRTQRLCDVPGFGPKTQQIAAAYGLHTVKQVQDLGLDGLKRLFGQTMAGDNDERKGPGSTATQLPPESSELVGWLYDIARGINNDVVEETTAAKSIGQSKNQRTYTDTERRHLLRWLVEKLCGRLEEDRLEHWRRPTCIVLSGAFTRDSPSVATGVMQRHWSRRATIPGYVLHLHYHPPKFNQTLATPTSPASPSTTPSSTSATTILSPFESALSRIANQLLTDHVRPNDIMTGIALSCTNFVALPSASASASLAAFTSSTPGTMDSTTSSPPLFAPLSSKPQPSTESFFSASSIGAEPSSSTSLSFKGKEDSTPLVPSTITPPHQINPLPLPSSKPSVTSSTQKAPKSLYRLYPSKGNKAKSDQQQPNQTLPPSLTHQPQIDLAKDVGENVKRHSVTVPNIDDTYRHPTIGTEDEKSTGNAEVRDVGLQEIILKHVLSLSPSQTPSSHPSKSLDSHVNASVCQNDQTQPPITSSFVQTFSVPSYASTVGVQQLYGIGTQTQWSPHGASLTADATSNRLSLTDLGAVNMLQDQNKIVTTWADGQVTQSSSHIAPLRPPPPTIPKVTTDSESSNNPSHHSLGGLTLSQFFFLDS